MAPEYEKAATTLASNDPQFIWLRYVLFPLKMVDFTLDLRKLTKIVSEVLNNLVKRMQEVILIYHSGYKSYSFLV